MEDNTPSRVAGIRQPSRFMMMLPLSDVLFLSSYLLCNAYMLCVLVCHRPFNNAATHFLPRFGIATNRHQHWVTYRLMFGLTKATRPAPKMRQRMRQKCVCCVAKGAPPSQLVVGVKSTIVLNVLTPTLVGPMLFVKYNANDSWSC